MVSLASSDQTCMASLVWSDDALVDEVVAGIANESEAIGPVASDKFG